MSRIWLVPMTPWPTPVLWLDASLATSLVLDGSNVTSWQSRGSNTATFANTSTNRPTYTASGIGSKPSLIFTRASLQNLQYAGQALTGTAGTLITVCTFGDVAGNQCVFAVRDTAVTNSYAQHLMWDKDGATARRLSYGTRVEGSTGATCNGNAGTGLTLATGYITCVTTTGAIDTEIRVNNSAIAVTETNTCIWGGAVPTVDVSLIGANRTNGDNGHGGQVAEIMVWNQVLKPAERNRVHRYLAAKYGITLA